MHRAQVNKAAFNTTLKLPYALKLQAFEIAMDDIYGMLEVINAGLIQRGLLPIESSLRGANYTAMLSDLMVEALASHAAGLVKNQSPNGHPDLIPVGRYANDAVASAEDGVEVKVTKKRGGGVDMHGARPAWYCVFRYVADYETEPVVKREPTRFTHAWLAQLKAEHFRKNPRGPLGTRTATPHREGLQVLRAGLLYSDP